jgi:hypothetical protein
VIVFKPQSIKNAMKQQLPPALRLLFIVLTLSVPVSIRAMKLCPAPGDTTYIKFGICPDDSIIVNGTVYNKLRPNGVEVIHAGKVDGTDSVIAIRLTILMPSENFLTQTYCDNQLLIVNGHLYGPDHPVGEEVVHHGAYTGCDSLIHVNLTFSTAPVYNLVQPICTGDTIWVGGVPYHAHHYVGTEVIDHGSYLGCDSTIIVDLTVLPRSVDSLTLKICPEDTIRVNGAPYWIGHREGVEILHHAAYTGCDSVVVVRLDFYKKPADYLGPDQHLVEGQQFCLNVVLNFVPTSITWVTAPPCPDPPCFDFCRQVLRSGSDYYISKIVAPGNCTLTDTLLLTVDRGRHVYGGNVFRPGAGSPNDRFFIQTDPSVRQIHWLRVFDRWGEEVFESTRPEISYAFGWDGTIKGQVAGNGVYAWAMEVEYLDGDSEIVTGDVTLLR